MFDDLYSAVDSFLGSLMPLSELDANELRIMEPPMIPAGEIVTVAGHEFIVLDSFGDGTTAVLQKNFLRSGEFGNSANWETSDLREYLNNEYYDEIAAAVGSENIAIFRRNLTTMDGTARGTCDDQISLLSFDEYRAYHSIIGNGPYPDWWWLLTRFSEQYSRNVCCVYDDGAVGCNGCDYGSGVRPFFLLKSEILTI